MKTKLARLASNLAALAFVLGGAGCVSPNLHVTRLTSGPTTSTGQSVQIYELGQKVDRPYEIVGAVSAIGQRAGVLSKARKAMLAEAKALGADALLGYYEDTETTVSTGDADGWAGALAVKFLPSGVASSPPSKAVVAIPHVAVGEDFGMGKSAEKADAIARKHARMLLAKKGYYAVLVEEQLSPGFPNGLKGAKDDARMKYGSSDADLILAVSLGKRHALNILLVAGATQAVGTSLYSKSANAIIWQNTGGAMAGDLGVAWGIGHLFVPNAKTIQSVHAALAEAFKTLPDLSSPSAPK